MYICDAMKNILLSVLIIILLSLCTNTVYSKNNSIDSLVNVINNNKNDYKTYIELAKTYSNNNIKDSAIIYCKAVINSNIPDSLTKYKSAAYLTIGTIYLEQAKHKESLEYFFKAVSIAEKNKDLQTAIGAYNNIGVCYYDLFEYAKAEEFLLKSINIINNNNVNYKIGNIYNNLGLIAHESNDYEKELNYLTKALVIYKQENDSLGMAIIIGNIARVKRAKGNYKLALKGFLESLKYFSKTNSATNIITLHMNIGITYLKMGRLTESLQHFNTGLKMSKENKFKELEMKILYNTSLVYKEMGDYKTSLKFIEDYHFINDSLFDKEKHKQISELNIKYNTIKKDKEISLLNKDKIIQEQRYKLQKRLMILLSLLIIFIVIFASVIFIFNRKQFLLYKNLVKKNIELLDKEGEIEKNKQEKTINKNITKEKSIEYNNTESENENDKYAYSKLDKDLVLEISELVTNALEKERIYLNNDLTINKLAEYLNINRTYLSQIINSHFKKNFSTFINEYRVKEAQKQLLTNNNITIEAISQEVGFKSKSAFNTAFKNYTGITPSFFIKNAKQ